VGGGAFSNTPDAQAGVIVASTVQVADHGDSDRQTHVTCGQGGRQLRLLRRTRQVVGERRPVTPTVSCTRILELHTTNCRDADRHIESHATREMCGQSPPWLPCMDA
jgi:hypothetical protein